MCPSCMNHLYMCAAEQAPCVQVELEGGEMLAFDDPTYVLTFAAQPDFDSDVLNLFYSSLAKPSTWFAHNMATGARVTKHVAPVLGGFDSSAYETRRLWAPSHDGVKVRPSAAPVSRTLSVLPSPSSANRCADAWACPTRCLMLCCLRKTEQPHRRLP